MWHPGILVLLAVFATALFGCISLVMTQRWHGWLSLDHDLNGIQKIHQRPVPRIGGIAVFTALLVGGLGALWIDEPLAPQILGLLLCSLPAFLAGLAEDLTKRVGVRPRLYSSFAAGALAIWLLDANLTRLNTPGLDMLIAFAPISVLFTCFAVGGFTNAINIIDGINGLAAGSAILMHMGLGALAWLHHDVLVFELCMLGIAALAGFMALNFPSGRIFLGDGGAYLTGFWLAECAVLLLTRHPGLSTWAVLLICAYPVYETIISVVRRNLIHRTSSGLPDQTHLHHVLLHRMHPRKYHQFRADWQKHAASSAVIWALIACCQVVAMATHPSSLLTATGVVWCGITYLWIYYRATRKAVNLVDFEHQKAGSGKPSAAEGIL